LQCKKIRGTRLIPPRAMARHRHLRNTIPWAMQKLQPYTVYFS